MKVSELLTDKSKWTQKTLARNMYGQSVDAEDHEACSWCIQGAVLKCYGHPKNIDIKERIYAQLGSLYIGGWNDDPTRTFAEVRSLVVELDI